MKQTLFQKFRSSFKPNFNIYEQEQWYKLSYNREQAEIFLYSKDIGTFVIRKSETIQDSHVLSVKVPKYINPSEISHYLITKSKSTSFQSKKSSSKMVFMVRGYAKEFPDLKSLVTHCSFMRDIIPVTLSLDFYRNNVQKKHEQMRNSFYFSSSTSSLTSDCGGDDLD